MEWIKGMNKNKVVSLEKLHLLFLRDLNNYTIAVVAFSDTKLRIN